MIKSEQKNNSIGKLLFISFQASYENMMYLLLIVTLPIIIAGKTKNSEDKKIIVDKK